MRAGRRQGGGVEQLHAIAQNHSTIILPSHKSPNNTETLLAIFKITQKRFLQMAGKKSSGGVYFLLLKSFLNSMNFSKCFVNLFQNFEVA